MKLGRLLEDALRARVVFFNDRFVAGSSSPIHRVDAAGDN